MRVLAVVVVLALVAVNGWQSLVIQAQMAEVAALAKRVDGLEAQLAHTQSTLIELESHSLEQQIKRANRNLVEGWQSFLQGLQEGVDASREALKEKELLDSQAPADDNLERT